MGKDFKTYSKKFDTILLGLKERQDDIKETINIAEFEKEMNELKKLRERYENLKTELKMVSGDLDDKLDAINNKYFEIKFKLLTHYGISNDVLNKFGIIPKK